MKRFWTSTALATSTFVGMGHGAAHATDLEVAHWWTSGGEAAAVKEFADAYDATGDRWVDAAIAGAGDVARPVMVSRIIGGDPMGAFQFNHGRQAEELIDAGLLRDLEDVAEKGNWREVIKPASLLDSCTVDGKIYCAPVDIHSQQWLWLSNKAFADAGIPVPTDWNEFVAAAPALEEAGIVPLAIGQQPWQTTMVFQDLLLAVGGTDVFLKVLQDRDADFARGAEVAKVFDAAATARQISSGSNVQDWNLATNMVIQGQAGGQIMGDWAQSEFAMAGQTAGEDYSCLPGLGLNPVIQTGGDAFYFPKIDDPDIKAAQDMLAETLVSPDVQVAFNLKKGALPVRGDVDLGAANDCMKKGLAILAKGDVVPAPDQMMSADSLTQINDLFAEFFADPEMTPADAQARFADLVASAE